MYLDSKALFCRIRSGELFGYVHCDLQVSEHLKDIFENIPPVFKNTLVSSADIGEYMKTYTEENSLLGQPRYMAIPSFHLVMVLLLRRFSIYTLIWDWNVLKIIALWNTVHKNVPTTLYNPLWMRGKLALKIQIRVWLLKQ